MSKPILVKLVLNKNVYEILTNHGMVEPYREGKIGWNKVCAVSGVYKDVSKGDCYTFNQLKDVFGTTDIEECMKQIVMEGELQLTTADRKRKTDELKKQIVNHLHKYFLDPKTMKPHPVVLLESAIDRTKVKVSLDQPFQRQVDEIVKKLPEFIAIRKCTMEGSLFIPHAHLGKALSIVAKYADDHGKKYTDEGCTIRIGVVPGCYDALMIEINSATKGEAVFAIDGIESPKSALPTQPHSSSKKELKQQKKIEMRRNNKNGRLD